MNLDKFSLLIIDPQVDFHEGGSLAVSGALNDSTRIANLILDKTSIIENIYITLDSHHAGHIATASFWVDSTGLEPQPFSQITFEDIQIGKWMPKDSNLKEFAKYYTSNLEQKGRFKLTIWPDHCIVNTPGHAVVPILAHAIEEWEKYNGKKTIYVNKGSNNQTEMYSALEAEIPLKDDPTTYLNKEFLLQLQNEPKILIGGQALSHCVNFTTRDLVNNWNPRSTSDLYILQDGSSPVPGCEQWGQDFLKDMKNLGLNVITTKDII